MSSELFYAIQDIKPLGNTYPSYITHDRLELFDTKHCIYSKQMELENDFHHGTYNNPHACNILISRIPIFYIGSQLECMQ